MCRCSIVKPPAADGDDDDEDGERLLTVWRTIATSERSPSVVIVNNFDNKPYTPEKIGNLDCCRLVARGRSRLVKSGKTRAVRFDARETSPTRQIRARRRGVGGLDARGSSLFNSAPKPREKDTA